MNPAGIVDGQPQVSSVINEAEGVGVAGYRIWIGLVGLVAFLAQEQALLRIDNLLRFGLRVFAVAALLLVSGAQIDRRRPGAQLGLLELPLEQEDAETDDVDGVVVVDVPVLGGLRPTLPQIVDQLELDDLLVQEELQRATELLGRQGEARSHVVVAQVLVPDHRVHQQNMVVLVECSRHPADESLRIDGLIRHGRSRSVLWKLATQ
mmetsp:Transcript_33869/g.99813  ORF Transcript_33869/g.99813 Transcript_33869/m.99813 type:complete len:207 (-) Transcript_33869:348-968(-)